MASKADDGTHRFTNRIEGVDFIESVFGDFVAYSVVVLTDVEHKPEQSTFRLVADLFRCTAVLLRRLRASQSTTE